MLKFVGAIKIGVESEEEALTDIRKIKSIYFCANQEETGNI